MPKLRLRLLTILGLVALRTAAAQLAPPSQSPVRYHFGDNPAWAAQFDDGAWPAASSGAWPVPPLDSDGIVWVRLRVPVPVDHAAGLAQRLKRPGFIAASEQVFVDGTLIGQSGKLPPAPQAVILQNSTFTVTARLPAQVSFATVAVRLWYPPSLRYGGGKDSIRAQLAPAEVLNERQRADRLALMLSWLPALSLSALLALVGVGLLGLWRWSHRRELLWFSLLLVLYPLCQFDFALPGLTSHPLSSGLAAGLSILGNATTMFVTVEFLWIMFGLRSRWLRILLHSAWVVFNAAELVASFATSGNARIAGSMLIAIVALTAFNFGTLAVELRFLITGPNRGIAAGMAVIPVASSLMFWLHLAPTNLFGIPHLDLFFAGFLFAGAFLSIMLVRRALAASRQGSLLRMEMAAAREVQQNLVPAVLPRIENCQLEAEYLPAQEVGGDFYQVIQMADGSSLIVVGDVSGKGLRAAMAGARAIGALRAIAAQTSSASALLRALNAQICATRDAGFITCLCASVKPDGTLALANAGHLPPYCNGHEVAVESGLPLGLDPDITYPETQVRLAPGDRLTLLSDGVAEARSATGELFGFDRTAQISTHSAEAIASAAQQFGQEDDITVLTLTFAPAEVLHA